VLQVNKNMKNIILKRRFKRKIKIKARIHGTEARPRLTVYRSNKYISAQVINDDKGKTIVSINSKNIKIDKTNKMNKSSISFQVGKEIAEKAIKKKIKKVIFDRSGYLYHGRIKAFADGAREGGLEF
jgi:large subunit ribosomal protein L18